MSIERGFEKTEEVFAKIQINFLYCETLIYNHSGLKTWMDSQ